ncbi:chitin synthase chs-1-like [Haliotis rufescens]|uniref:chitin synthase chs-1-like n=2 Tax=Haliotis rufescens TaxID=6454 RepID=UPI00201EDDA6|nr:chitin synthase chs-1-like [Haliotis rufescens]XP_048245327.1 chitin synthase chs-1-like [Haliotis rufescens]XP_048245328.1 chitin synthase chs-1-like [Haliotis rufescens]
MFRAPYLPNGDVPGQGVDNRSYCDSDMTYDESNHGLDDTFDEDAEEGEEDRVSHDDLEEEDHETSQMNWDVFRVVPRKEEHVRNLRFWNRVYVGVRITLCGVIFLFVLGTGTFTKLCFLLIAYNMNYHHAAGGDALSGAAEDVTVRVAWIWSMLILITAPYVFTILRNIFRVIFKKQKQLQIIPFLVVMLFETCHTLGLCIFVFLVAPTFDPVMVLLLCQGVGFVPAFNKIFWTRKENANKENSHEAFASPFWRSVSVITFILQGVFIGVSTWKGYVKTARPSATVILLPLSLVLISMRWWDNFIQRKKSVTPKSEKQKVVTRFDKPQSFTDLLKRIDTNRVKIDLLVSVWKIVLTCIILVILFGSSGGECWDTLMFESKSGVGCGVIPGLKNLTLVNQFSTDCGYYTPYIVAASSVILSGIGYKMAKSACKIRSQLWCFSLPLALCTPLSCVVLLATISSTSIENIGCDLAWISSHNQLFKILKQDTESYYFPIICGGFLSILLVCAHIWVPKAGRVAATDKLFNRPLYCGAFFDTSLMMNRRSDDNINIQKNDSRTEKIYLSNTPEQNLYRESSRIPFVYICVTMWHETKVEMLQLLKSILKMDLDNASRAHVQQLFGEPDTDFYNMEAHIIFDNAFGNQSNGEDKYLVNTWVKDFVSCINQAVSQVYPSMASLSSPVIIPTPYGGRMVFTLPGGNELIVHLKHKDKIRIKKRWSQVMYMYYLLSHKMVCKPGMSGKVLSRMSRNTFILTLDGDVDFQPSAVQMLLDRMKKDSRVGAACGRIHPIGSGPMIWYQKFEYAMSHWLQKAAEHVIGCVLCSPGCFSMFRASALMEDNVLRKYAELSAEPRHHVQHDQGEDRWLCTLILQQGSRIEYVAAADAKTYAPEGFREFYNQRRRWTPSTMANVLDVLQSAGEARRKNNDISFLYIMYQGLLFVSSVLTPGTIFLIIFSAINTAYPELPLYAAMILNLVPVVIFVVLLFTAKDDIQIAYAGILSIVYALVMTIVLVGLFKQVVESNFCSMTAGFFLFVVGVFLLSAMLHPQEFITVVYGFFYFLAIPCMSMLLMFYSFGNLNVVSWGTRETAGKSVSENVADVPQHKMKNKSALHGILNKMKGSADDSDSDYVFSFGNMLRCICCPRPVLRDQTAKIELLIGKMEDMEYALKHKDDGDDASYDGRPTASNEEGTPFSHVPMMFDGGMRSNPMFEADPELMPAEDDEFGDPRWISDKALGETYIEELSEEETNFWNELITQHLKPLHLSDKQKDEVAQGLTHLRNTVCTFFFLSNVLFVTMMFILESVSEYTPSLVFKLPCDTGDHGATREPVAIAFTLIFGILLFIQFICMLFHRWSTLLAIASITEFHFKSEKTMAHERENTMSAVEEMYVRNSLKEDDNRSVLSEYSDVTTRGETISRRHRDNLMARFLRDASQKRQEQPNSLNAIFTAHMKKISENEEVIKDGVDETKGAVSESVKRIFPSVSNQSLFTIANMVKNDKQKERIKTMATKNWENAFKRIKTPKLLDIVNQAKRQDETEPKVRFAQEQSKGNDRASIVEEIARPLKVSPSEDDKAPRASGWQTLKTSRLLRKPEKPEEMQVLGKETGEGESFLTDSSTDRIGFRDSHIAAANEKTDL